MSTCDACGASIGDHRAEADADHIKVNTEVLQLRLMEKRRELARSGEVDALIDDIAGTVFSVEPACAVRAGAIECSRSL